MEESAERRTDGEEGVGDGVWSENTTKQINMREVVKHRYTHTHTDD